MLFYRVCHRDVTGEIGLHVGPYNTGGLAYSENLNRMAWRHADYLHPTVRVDVDFGEPCERSDDWDDDTEEWHNCYSSGCIKNMGDYVCGFTSLDMLKEWFHGYRKMLREEDFVMRVWDIPAHEIIEGGSQAVARIDALADAGHKVRRIP